MTTEWILLFAGATSFSAMAFVCVAVMWLRKLRESVSSALSEAASQQIRTTQRMGESIARLQKQQDNYTQQIHTLAQAGLRLQQELSNVANRLENNSPETPRGGQTVH